MAKESKLQFSSRMIRSIGEQIAFREVARTADFEDVCVDNKRFVNAFLNQVLNRSMTKCNHIHMIYQTIQS